MSSIVTSVLSTTIGLLWNKARDVTAAKLKNGDIADARLRELVVRELNDIKGKLDGMSRKDLLGSFRFLKEGVDLLNATLNQYKEDYNASLNESPLAYEISKLPCKVEAAVLGEALQISHELRKLKLDSNTMFESAKKRFEEARKRATDAFCNEALSIKDRIFAAKLRIVSEILEYLDSPETAIMGCLSFLQELLELPSVREIFGVYLKRRGVKSKLNKAERVEQVKSVMLINYVLYQFVSKFDTKHSFLLAWPTIKITGDRTFHPLLHWNEVSARSSWGEDLTEPPNKLTVDDGINSFLSAVNGRGEIIVPHNDNIKVISKTGEMKLVNLPAPGEGEVSPLHNYIAELAIDLHNNVYLIRWFKTTTANGEMNSFALCELDSNYQVKQNCTFNLLDETVHDWVKIAINQSNNLIMVKKDDPHVYVCENTGQLKHKIELESRPLPILGLINKSEVMLSLRGSSVGYIHIYTEEGVKISTIAAPEGHEVRGVAFHHLNCKIVVLTKLRQESLYLLCYSGKGVLESSTFLCNWNDCHWETVITSHSCGPIAVVSSRNIIYI